MFAPATVSAIPISQAATTAPSGLSRPPRTAAASAYTRIVSIMFGCSGTLGATRQPASPPSIAARPQPTSSSDPTGSPSNRAEDGLSAAVRRARPSRVRRKNSCSSTTVPTSTPTVPTSPQVALAPRIETTPSENSDPNARTDPPQTRLISPLKQMSTATVATIATSGSWPSKRRISSRSVSAPMTSEATSVSPTAGSTGSPLWTSDHPM